jgi:hypothetical protein
MQQVLAWAHLSDIIGYVASALVLATFSMRSMRWLRMTAIASNVAFIGCREDAPDLDPAQRFASHEWCAPTPDRWGSGSSSTAA